MLDLYERRPAMVLALSDLVSTALFRDLDEEAAALLEALRLWRPRGEDVRFYDAWFAIRRNDLAEATRILRALHEDSTGNAADRVRTLLACCLLAEGHDEGMAHIEALEKSATAPAVIAMVRRLRGEGSSAIETTSVPAETPAIPTQSPTLQARGRQMSF